MVQRCTNPKHPQWKNYGARGVRVCDEWVHNSAAFIAYMGPRPSSLHSLDKINNNGNYEPGNVRWATREQQAKNKRAHYRIEYLGKRNSLTGWAETLGVNRETLRRRLRSGFPMEAAVLSAEQFEALKILTKAVKP